MCIRDRCIYTVSNWKPATNNRFQQGKPEETESIQIARGIAIVVVILVALGILFGGGASSVVQSGALEDYPDKTIGDAFEERFENCEWSAEDLGDATYVTFTGYDPDTLSSWQIVFKVLDTQFRVESIAVDGEYYTDALSVSALLEYIYTGNTDLLLGYAFLQALFS